MLINLVVLLWDKNKPVLLLRNAMPDFQNKSYLLLWHFYRSSVCFFNCLFYFILEVTHKLCVTLNPSDTDFSLSCHTVSHWTEKWTRDKKTKHATLGSTNWKVKGQELQKSELIQKERVAQPQFQLSVTRTGAENSAWGHRLLPKHLLLFFCTTVSFFYI